VVPTSHDLLLTPLDHAALVERRRRLLARGHGRVLDLSGGTGTHLAMLRPDRVTELVVARGRPSNLGALRRRARDLSFPSVVDVDVADISGPFDTVIAQFVLSAVRDLGVWLRFVRDLQVGQVLFVDPAPLRGGRLALGELARPFLSGIGGQHELGRDVVARLRAAGFTITDVERFSLPTLVIPLRHLVAGVARPAKVRT
jgi:hypothetical protein